MPNLPVRPVSLQLQGGQPVDPGHPEDQQQYLLRVRDGFRVFYYTVNQLQYLLTGKGFSCVVEHSVTEQQCLLPGER